jgi:FtsH-binding integral membrane protein
MNNYGYGEMSGAMTAANRGTLALVQKIYGLFLLCILAAVGTGGLLMTSPAQDVGHGLMVPSGVVAAYNANILIFIVAILLLIGMRAVGRMPGINVVVMLAFASLMGAMATPQVFIHTAQDGPGTVYLAGAMTTIVFVGLSLIAFLSRTDFNFLGAGLMVALLALIVGSLLNGFFFHAQWVYMMYSWLGVVIFSGFVLFDTSRILRQAREDDAVICAISIFLDALNLFLLILNLLGGRRR